MICLIPARKGSKRIPNKNFKNFLGCPIIKYPIHTAKDSKLFNKIVIMTDEERFYCEGTNTYLRQEKNAQDNSTLTDAVLEFLDYKKLHRGELCVIFPTSIWATYKDLKKAYSEFKDCDALFSITKYPHPIQRAFIKSKNYLKIVNHEYMFSRTQDLPIAYFDAGQFYFIDIESFREQKKIFMEYSKGFDIEAIDIDTEEDWRKAEILYAAKYE